MKPLNTCIMLVAASCTALAGTSEAHAGHCYSRGSVGISLPGVGLYIGPGGVSVGIPRYHRGQRQFYIPPVSRYPRHNSLYYPPASSTHHWQRGRQFYVPPVTIHPRRHTSRPAVPHVDPGCSPAPWNVAPPVVPHIPSRIPSGSHRHHDDYDDYLDDLEDYYEDQIDQLRKQERERRRYQEKIRREQERYWREYNRYRR